MSGLTPFPIFPCHWLCVPRHYSGERPSGHAAEQTCSPVPWVSPSTPPSVEASTPPLPRLEGCKRLRPTTLDTCAIELTGSPQHQATEGPIVQLTGSPIHGLDP